MARVANLVREGRVADARKPTATLLAEHPDLKPGWGSASSCCAVRGDRGRAAAGRGCAGPVRAIRRSRSRSRGGAHRARALSRRPRHAGAGGRVRSRPRAGVATSWGMPHSGWATETVPCSRSTGRFALEPHTETLPPARADSPRRGRYQAAEVAYEGAAQAAEHAEQRAGGERETRQGPLRFPTHPAAGRLTPERWFAETGTVVSPPTTPRPPDAMRSRRRVRRSACSAAWAAPSYATSAAW